ncbi:MAG: hypothetical protein GY715_00810 [Planctomycetes bacterium]|nr:hypothetical protein [Planctomycetota bacterium]
MSNGQPAEARSHAFWMLISAGLFAYFGFVMGWAHRYTGPQAPQPGQLIPMVAVLMWTIRGSAIGFGASWLISLTGSTLGPLLYAVVGLVGAVIFVVVAVWEWTNPQGYFSGIPAILLLIFAVWNGAAAVGGLRSAFRRVPAGAEP